MHVPASTSTLRAHARFRSQFLPDPRDITVFLPPGYEQARGVRYPVLYMHDGQNLFDPAAAFKKGEHWRVGETASELIEAGRLNPLIIVGIANTGPRRIHEYTPTYDRRRGGGEADAYGRLIVDELKPLIDSTYRTLPDPINTAMAGSSLGGLVTLYLGLKRPGVFSRLGAMSPSVWWDRRAVLRTVREARPKPHVRIWVDMGTREGRQHLENARLLKVGLVRAGWIESEDLSYEEVTGGTHSEVAWGNRFGRMIEWLFDDRGQVTKNE
jgi:predicted alpha/beta superfamily hydrolase